MIAICWITLGSQAAGFTGASESFAARHRLLFNSVTGAQVNPLGLQTVLQAGYRRRLIFSASPLLKDTFVGAMIRTGVNPAFTRIGGLVELQPLTVLTLRARYERRGYFGVAKMLLSFESPEEAHDDETMRERSAAGENYIGYGHQVTLQSVLRAKAGPVALLDEFNAHYFQMDLRGADRVFYDAFFDTLVPGNGWVLTNHAHLVYLAPFRLNLGVRYTVVHALYPTRWLNDQTAGNPNTPTHRLGPLVTYTFRSSWQHFQQPTLVVFFNWWIKNRYRTGQHVSQAVPYAVVALLFSGDIWSR